jgi:hypothetical protein
MLMKEGMHQQRPTSGEGGEVNALLERESAIEGLMPEQIREPRSSEGQGLGRLDRNGGRAGC